MRREDVCHYLEDISEMEDFYIDDIGRIPHKEPDMEADAEWLWWDEKLLSDLPR